MVLCWQRGETRPATQGDHSLLRGSCNVGSPTATLSRNRRGSLIVGSLLSPLREVFSFPAERNPPGSPAVVIFDRDLSPIPADERGVKQLPRLMELDGRLLRDEFAPDRLDGGLGGGQPRR